jgi:hypothetical protein
MYITTTTSKGKKKTYQSVLLRESYREGGKVKNRTIANLSHCKPNEIEAIRLALKYKDDLSAFQPLTDKGVDLRQGQSIGAVWTVYTLARRLGLEKALGTDHNGKLALWQVLARVLDQGSRLSAVRLAQVQAAGDVLGFSRGFDENDLYDNLRMLSEKQAEIEQRLFTARRGNAKPQLFLYDVTSSYLEGDKNALGDWGYNRDKKRGKKQIVIGLLCDEEGEPVSTEVFAGNTLDFNTFESQVKKAAEIFGCERVTFVGDRGMIKSGQIKDLAKAGFNYITAITKPQIRSMLNKGVFQMSLFDELILEIEHEGVRYILRKNPTRAEEMTRTRASKQAAIYKLMDKQNEYLAAHPRADVFTAWQKVLDKSLHLQVDRWLRVKVKNREQVTLEVDEEALAEISLLDGCYVIKTDLPAEIVDKETIHHRYKDLVLVESAFRTVKTAHLEVRPVYVRTEASTRGHVLVVMLAYLIVRELQKAWADLDLTVEEGLSQLACLSSIKMRVGSQEAYVQKIPVPGPISSSLLKAAGVTLPRVLPCRDIRVVTRKKLPKQRKTN